MILLQWTFDTLLELGLLWLIWRALASPDLFEAIVLFVAFGSLMALAWVRLDAPDVALAEASIGAGLTGCIVVRGAPSSAGAWRPAVSITGRSRSHSWPCTSKNQQADAG